MNSAPKYTVLSIDDSKAVHAFLDHSQSEAGSEFSFVHVMGVKEGLNILSQGLPKISLVLLDWEMPEISGFDGLPMILGKVPTTPVIVVTSKNDPECISQMLERGAKEYIMKPFTPDILFEKLRSVISV